jgi:hypothetical protein
LFCFVLFCFVLFCFVLVWFVLFWFGLFWFVLFCFVLVWFVISNCFLKRLYEVRVFGVPVYLPFLLDAEWIDDSCSCALAADPVLVSQNFTVFPSIHVYNEDILGNVFSIALVPIISLWLVSASGRVNVSSNLVFGSMEVINGHVLLRNFGISSPAAGSYEFECSAPSLLPSLIRFTVIPGAPTRLHAYLPQSQYPSLASVSLDPNTTISVVDSGGNVVPVEGLVTATGCYDQNCFSSAAFVRAGIATINNLAFPSPPHGNIVLSIVMTTPYTIESGPVIISIVQGPAHALAVLEMQYGFQTATDSAVFGPLTVAVVDAAGVELPLSTASYLVYYTISIGSSLVTGGFFALTQNRIGISDIQMRNVPADAYTMKLSAAPLQNVTYSFRIVAGKPVAIGTLPSPPCVAKPATACSPLITVIDAGANVVPLAGWLSCLLYYGAENATSSAWGGNSSRNFFLTSGATAPLIEIQAPVAGDYRLECTIKNSDNPLAIVSIARVFGERV